MNKQFSIAVGLASLILGGVAGCQSAWVEIDKGQTSYSDRFFARDVKISNIVREKTDAGFLDVTIEVRNVSDQDIPCQYQFEWKRANGMILAHANTPWRQKMLESGKTESLYAISPQKDIADFRFFLKPTVEHPKRGVTVTEAVEDLLHDSSWKESFAKACESARKSGLPRPVVSFARFESNVKGVGNHETKRIYRSLERSLRKTELFSVMDVETREKMIEELEDLVKTGGKTLDPKMQRFGDYEIADFVFHGELREDLDGRFLDLLITDSASGGGIIWNTLIAVDESID